jgi:hypothetical protein
MRTYQRHFARGAVFGLILAMAVMGFIACNDASPTTPHLSAPSPADPPSSPVAPVAVPDGPSAGPLEQCGLRAKPATFSGSMTGTTITAFIGADYSGPGEVIVYLWDPELNAGDQYGAFPANEAFNFDVPAVKPYDFRVAVEVDLDGDGKADAGCQDDRHRLKVAPTSTPRTPPPSCETYELALTVDDTTVVATLRDRKENVVADKSFPRLQQDYTSSICVGDFGGEQAGLAEACCFPVEIPRLVPLCERDPGNEACAPTCEFGSATWDGQIWTCPSCEEVNPPSYSSTTNRKFHSSTSYWQMQQGSENARENACENRGGQWLDDHNIPGDGNDCLVGGVSQFRNGLEEFFNRCDDVCKFHGTDPPGNPGNDMGLYDPPGVVGSGIDISAVVTFHNAGGSASLVCGGVEKDRESIEVECGHRGELSLHYEHPTAHTDSECEVVVTQ